jgi:polysaccharide deacetylase family protein (PEP-CTERM system associated)
MRHGLSFDVECWHQLSARRVDGVPSEPSVVVDDCVARILDLCDEMHVKATFFVLGMLAQSRPHLVRAIAARGHEIASHSLNHQLVHSMRRDEFFEDLRDSKELLEDLSGTPVVGFRAPEFSVQRIDHPCFESMCKLGFRYDSSVFPASRLRYGIPGAPAGPFRLTTSSGCLVELPLATVRIGGLRLPIAGGSHFRVLPTQFLTWAAGAADSHGDSLVFYFHPYEFTKKFLYLPGGLARNRSIAKHVALHNFGTSRVERSLRALGARLEFVPLRELAGGIG